MLSSASLLSTWGRLEGGADFFSPSVVLVGVETGVTGEVGGGAPYLIQNRHIRWKATLDQTLSSKCPGFSIKDASAFNVLCCHHKLAMADGANTNRI